jgi:hypothetical protein
MYLLANFATLTDCYVCPETGCSVAVRILQKAEQYYGKHLERH